MEEMISPDRALELVLSVAQPLDTVELPLVDCVGMVLAETVAADRDYPPFNRAMMDGYAVHISDSGRTVEVIGELSAGSTWDTPLEAGSALEIMTGAPCPEGIEAVIQKERVHRNDNTVQIPEGIGIGLNIAEYGGECPAGHVVLSEGDVLNPIGISLLATVGRPTVRVRPFPSAGIISTGDELVNAGEDPGPGSIRDGNGPMLRAMCYSMGLKHVTHLYARDNPVSLSAALNKVGDNDLIMLIGGVSAGKYDLVPQALEAVGANAVFHKVTQRPGKPLLFAARDQQLFFGLPGNPLSAHMGFQRYIKAAIRELMGRKPVAPGGVGRLMETTVVRGDRSWFALARVERVDDGYTIRPIHGKGSADVFAAGRANAMICFRPPPYEYLESTQLEFEWIMDPC
jgi:molybdopterin molybdotransferase